MKINFRLQVWLILLLLFSFGVIGQGVRGADRQEGHADSLAEVLQQILNEHQVSTLSKLECSEVSKEEWEMLGEAVMTDRHPNPTEHEAMDRMMGGEGSESLRRAHVQMGRSYLGCLNAQQEMGPGMMGIWGLGHMDGHSPWGTGVRILGLVFWSTIIAVLFAIARYFWKKAN